MRFGTPEIGDSVLCVEFDIKDNKGGSHNNVTPGTVTDVGVKYFYVKTDYTITQYKISDWSLSSSTDIFEMRPRVFPSKEVYDDYMLRKNRIKEIRTYCNNRCALEELSTEALGIIHDTMYQN